MTNAKKIQNVQLLKKAILFKSQQLIIIKNFLSIQQFNYTYTSIL